MRHSLKTVITMTAVCLTTTPINYAGSFSLYTEASAAKIGNFAAGAAAEGGDASIGYYNPAGLALLHQQQAVISGVGVIPSIKLTGVSTFEADSLDYIQTFSGIQGAPNAAVPALHYAKPYGPNTTWGISITSPFGLSTDWAKTSPVRYAATLSELKTINFSPEVGQRITDHLALGGGIDVQWAQVIFNQMLGVPVIPAQLPTTFDSLSTNTGHSFGVGFHAGLLGLFNDEHTRIGLNYQSQMKHRFHGTSELTGPLAYYTFENPNAHFVSRSLSSNTITLPDLTTFSLYQDINHDLALLGSIVYTGWHSFQTIQLNQVAAYSFADAEPAIVNVTSQENYINVWRFALGANYHFNSQWMLRGGMGYDQTPTVNAERNVRLPDANRWALSIGSHYQWRPSVGFDVGYTYLWAKDFPTINRTDVLDPTAFYQVQARSRTHAHLIGLQAVWTVDGV